MDSSPGWTCFSPDSVTFLLIRQRHLDYPEVPRAARTVSSVGLIPLSSIADSTVSVAMVQVLVAAVDYWRQGFGASLVLRDSGPPMA